MFEIRAEARETSAWYHHSMYEREMPPESARSSPSACLRLDESHLGEGVASIAQTCADARAALMARLGRAHDRVALLSSPSMRSRIIVGVMRCTLDVDACLAPSIET